MFGLSEKITTYITGGLLAIILVLALALTITRGTLHKRTEKLATVTKWQSDVRQITSLAAHVHDNKGNPGLLALDQVQAQIVILGNEVDAGDTKIAEQNKAIDDMAASSAAKIAAGNAALAKVEQGRAAAEKAVSALRASAVGNEGNDGACTPSKAFLANSGVL